MSHLCDTLPILGFFVKKMHMDTGIRALFIGILAVATCLVIVSGCLLAYEALSGGIDIIKMPWVMMAATVCFSGLSMAVAGTMLVVFAVLFCSRLKRFFDGL